jgi:hypothetical protein
VCDMWLSNLTYTPACLCVLQEDEEDYGTEYLVQPVQPEDDEGASDFEPGEGDNEDDEDEFEDEEEDVVEEAVKEPMLVKGKRSREEDEEKEGRPLKR